MRYCLIGEKLSHSYSEDIHRSAGIDYSLKEVESNKLSDFIKSGEFDGFNVTIPYKKDVIPLLDGISEEAKEIGAVNTVVKKGGKLYGYNTDIGGLSYIFERKGYSLKGKKVAVLGTGGTSNTAVYLCKKQGASVSVIGRNSAINYTNCYDLLKDTEVIINATPVGMYPDVKNAPIDVTRFLKLQFVADCVYNPLRTELLIGAEKLGIECSNGLPMLVRQALLSESIWTGDEKIKGRTEEILKDIYRSKSNIVLFGMPSSGKSSIGKLLAERTGREFIDTDVLTESITGMSPSLMIKNSGEEAFRVAESRAIEGIALSVGKVISLGGGAILKEENVKAIKRNGIAVYIKRDLSLLSADDRPISEKEGIENLYLKRKSFYEAAADCEAVNDKDLDYAVRRVEEVYENTCDKRR